MMARGLMGKLTSSTAVGTIGAAEMKTTFTMELSITFSTMLGIIQQA